MKLGAQLYTVREFTKTLQDFSETLFKIAQIGYKTVQVSGTCAYEPEWLAEQLKINGLACPLTHFKSDRVADDSATVAQEHKVFQCGIIGLGSAPGIFNGSFDYDVFRDRFLPAAKKIRDVGCILGYHNHQFEFEKTDGITILERIAADFPADTLTFILDTYWVQYAGGDPAAWIKTLSGRVHCVHLKDMEIIKGEQRMAVIGEGNINFDAVLTACQCAGTQSLLVEQDDCYGENPFNCLERSYKYLKSQGLE